MSELALPTLGTLGGSVGVSLEATPPGLADSESQCLFLGWGVEAAWQWALFYARK